MKEFIEEYINIKNELEKLKNEDIKRAKYRDEAYKDILNSGIYDGYVKCENIINYVKESLKKEKNKIIKSNHLISILEYIIFIYENSRTYATESTFSKFKSKENKNDKK